MKLSTWIIIGFLAWVLFVRQPQPTSAGNRGIVVGDTGWLSKVDSIVGNIRGLFGGIGSSSGGSAGGGYGEQSDGSYTIPAYEDQGTVGDASADAQGGTT